jgi:hypothetical protein
MIKAFASETFISLLSTPSPYIESIKDSVLFVNSHYIAVVHLYPEALVAISTLG